MHILKVIIILLMHLGSYQLFAQDEYFAALYNVKARPIALGGAFTSVEDDLAAVLYNPGSFKLYQNKKDFRLTFFLNPLGSYLAFQEESGDFTSNISDEAALHNASLLFKGIVLTSRSFNLGVILGEESIGAIKMVQSPKFFNYNELRENSAHTAFVNMKLANRVSIGISGTSYKSTVEEVKTNGYGFSYGILLKPSERINVGLSYMDFPEKFSNFRFPIERIMDETMNVGISYSPFNSTIITADVKNLTEENKSNVRELHLGFEQTVWGLAGIRMGFFRERLTKNNRYSIGLGLLDSNLLNRGQDRFYHRQFVFNYSYVYEENDATFNRWHFFSFLYRF